MKSFRYIMFSILLVAVSSVLSGCEKLLIFDPQGPVAKSQADLIIFSIIFMLVIVVVVFVLFGYIIWKYRETNRNKDYEPPHEHGSKLLEALWIGIPIVIVIALTIPTVITTYELEEIPEGYENVEPITIHVTSADWKWIFSYPEQDIETVNYFNIPAGVPVQFKMTSTGTMQSFWVPALGGQKYTMANMQTELYLLADRPGSYIGRNTSFNGEGYAHMEFEVEAQTQEDFDKWVSEVKATASDLTEEKHYEIIEPGLVGRMTFNGTHLEWIDHSESEYHNHGGESHDEHGSHSEEDTHENHEDHGDHGDHDNHDSH
ncbi:cytochrome aa3 quinol oxidase subunit II [Litchfieldia salsa]|uniref:Quinol oxidase subunit 2 n=1 Tax=Litchfieldia salsa TaxID=930152 RepID=A0A1H0X3X4_9BACI|nr:cytochrome aa3 quinol oxidase subunit II [Litchfieldia salsa]SDP97425.1 cytochrome aa3 quinol oxidase subunit 2 [Litchfieldia salsa]